MSNIDPDPAIHKFSPNGDPILTWAVADGPGPIGVAIDTQGNVYVALHRLHDHYIEKYDPWGKLLGTWAKPVTEGGQIIAGPGSGPADVAVDTNGDNYIADPEQVHKYDKNGNYLYSLPDGASLTLDSQGNLYLFTDPNTFLKFDRSGNQIGKWSAPFSGENHWIAVDKDSNIFITFGPEAGRAILAKIKLPMQ